VPDVTEPRVPNPVRVLIVDDDALVRSALMLMLGGRSDLTVLGEAHDGEQAVIATRELRPDVVLMDIRMPGIDGIEATRRLVAAAGAPRVIVLTTFDTDEHVFAAIAAGAEGFLVKDTSPADLIAAIKTVAAGESMLSPSVTTTLVAHVRAARAHPTDNDSVARLARLTERELGVAIAIGRGLSNAAIAAELFMSVATVKAHVTRVFDKLETTNRVQVAICVRDADLL
jgi:DNA-binding NarL/FixJ family response regulator